MTKKNRRYPRKRRSRVATRRIVRARNRRLTNISRARFRARTGKGRRTR